jgi:Rrf2 family protein
MEIMKISKKAEYGLTAMVHLAKNNKTTSIRQISKIEGVPFEFLSKIFSALEKGKLVTSRHGANGGYALAKKPDKIAVADVVKLLESINTVNCAGCIRSKKCLAKNVWNKIDMALNKTLNGITLEELIK